NKIGVVTIALTGGKGGELAKLAKLSIIAASSDTPSIQESHMVIYHILCELIENGYAR
ncbi:MAG: phosphoheptose isomerase, partial [Candidatus Omnitrophica bacterium CG10_big_fil_rev_8_21_14_0_10_43_8]